MGELKQIGRQAAKDPAFASSLKAALGGDPVAHARVLEWLTANAQEAVERYIQHQFGATHNTSQDLAQKSLIKLWNGVRDGRGKPDLLPDAFFEWLICLVWKTSLAHLRDKGREEAAEIAMPVLPAHALLDPAPGGPTRALKDEKVRALKAAIGALDAKQQRLALAYLEHPADWSAISQLVGLTPRAARAMFEDYVGPALANLMRTAVIERTAKHARASSKSGPPLHWPEVEAAAAKAHLNRQYVEILRLRLLEGLSNEKVAEKLSLPPETTASIYSIARAHVNSKLQEDDRELPPGRVLP